MAKLEEYQNKYKHFKMERKNGILQVTFHTDGGTLQWGPSPYIEFPKAFTDIGGDPQNKVVIFTGAGDDFTGPFATPHNHRPQKTTREWYNEYWGGKRLIMNLLDIEVPTIAAVNGAAYRHSELALFCDIVIGSDTVVFQDTGHFMNGLVPGDGMHIIYPLLLGLNRGKYFLMTGQRIDAQKALELGLLVEVMAKDKLLPRAWELAELFLKQPPLVTRFTKAILTQQIKRAVHETLGYGLAVEGMAVAEGWSGPQDVEY